MTVNANADRLGESTGLAGFCFYSIEVFDRIILLKKESGLKQNGKEELHMNEMALKYGCNPNQKIAKVYMKDGKDLPFTVLNGRPGFINLLDAFNSWQLVKELKEATGLPAAASFKHVSPAGAAVATELSDTLKKIYFVDDLELTPIASAYAAARGADRMSSYGDFAALSDICDKETALLLKREVSDGVIAPGYTEEALEILKSKRKGTYLVMQMDADYVPEEQETKQVFGISFEQSRNNAKITADLLAARIHCTRLAGNKADIWWQRQNPKVMALPFKADIRRPDRDNTIDVYISDDYEDVLAEGTWQLFFTEKPEPLTKEEKKAWAAKLTGVALGSDAFFPFGDNIERAHRSGVQYVAEAGGSIRDDHVIETADKYNMAVSFTHLRLFHH